MNIRILVRATLVRRARRAIAPAFMTQRPKNYVRGAGANVMIATFSPGAALRVIGVAPPRSIALLSARDATGQAPD